MFAWASCVLSGVTEKPHVQWVIREGGNQCGPAGIGNKFYGGET